MNKILPKIELLEPIVDSRYTFYDTPMVRDFSKLDDIEMLQVLADIVKQSMIYEEYPDPTIELQTLIGNDYTSSKVFLSYLESLNMFKNSKLVLVPNRKKIDINSQNNFHFVVLVKGINDKEYIVDTTPSIGYGIGEVNDLTKNDLYTKYIEIDETMDIIINIIRKDMYDINNNLYSEHQINNFNSVKNVFKNSYFNGLLIKYFKVINSSDFEKLKIIFNSNFLDQVLDIKEIQSENNRNKILKIRNWQKLLDDLIINDNNYKKQQKLAQYIAGELDDNMSIIIDGKEILLKHITPRLMWEKRYNVVILKPSAFLVGNTSSITDMMVPNYKDIIMSYSCNLGNNNKFGLRPMNYFHPHGLKYETQMNGPNKIMLVNESASKLNERKRYIRSNIAQNIAGHYVEWYNGERIKWDPNLNTNLVHSTDDATEASIHLLAAYPEYQSFTRYNYPNPILRKEKIK